MSKDLLQQGLDAAFTAGFNACLTEIEALRAAIAQPADQWKEAVLNELIVAHIYTAEHDTNPRKALQDAIAWNCQVALDPAVSADAQALIDKGKSQPVQPASPAGPTEIWLQLHSDCTDDELLEPVDYTSGHVTWCWHAINDSDVRYVRADLTTIAQPDPLKEVIARHRAALSDGYQP